MLAQKESQSSPAHSVRFAPKLLLANDDASLYDAYNSMFEVIIADSQDLIDECYKLRYQVYCVEQPHLNLMYGEFERDAYDGAAVHTLLRHRASGRFVGTVRVIIDNKDLPQRTPIHQFCDEHSITLPAAFYTRPHAEISRFCVAKNFRRRITDSIHETHYTARELATMRGRVIPVASLGLMSMIFRICHEHRIDYCCAVMEPARQELLKKLGIHFKSVGPIIDFHGARQVTYLTHQELHTSLQHERPDVLDFLTEQGRYPFTSNL